MRIDPYRHGGKYTDLDDSAQTVGPQKVKKDEAVGKYTIKSVYFDLEGSIAGIGWESHDNMYSFTGTTGAYVEMR